MRKEKPQLVVEEQRLDRALKNSFRMGVATTVALIMTGLLATAWPFASRVTETMTGFFLGSTVAWAAVVVAATVRYHRARRSL